jgi:hypothetical protein
MLPEGKNLLPKTKKQASDEAKQASEHRVHRRRKLLPLGEKQRKIASIWRGVADGFFQHSSG